MWQRLEPIHAVVYFAPEVIDAYKAVGLKGFWMGYFAGRSAPLGPASAELVTSTFFNFHPDLVRRAVPDAWSFAAPEAVLSARWEALDRVLRRVLGDAAGSPEVTEAAELVEEATSACALGGRPLFAAHASLTPPPDPHLRLWHGATLIREHRGDGHIAALLAYGLDGLDAHITFSASGAIPRETLQPNRGWSDEEWEGAAERLVERGLLAPDGSLTEEGRAVRDEVEHTTDLLAAAPWLHLGRERTERLAELLRPLARAVASSRTLPFPNPMGLPEE